MDCPATLPFSFASHAWLVANRKGSLMWYGVSWRKAQEESEVFGGHVCRGCVGYLHRDSHGVGEGIEMLPSIGRPLWKGRVVSSLEGSEESLAAHMIAFMESSFCSYPYRDRYRLTGPNSNTYPAWVLAHFPEADLSLPWNAVGKKYGVPVIDHTKSLEDWPRIAELN